MEQSLYAAAKEWRDEHAPGVPVADLLANEVRTVELHATIYPKGYASMSITVNARRPHNTEVSFERYRHVGGQWFFS